MFLKKCFKCDSEKPISEFYRHSQMSDGRLGKCKECAKADVSSNYRKRRRQYAEYEKKRQKRPERRVRQGGYLRKRRKLNPEKYESYNAVRNALKTGSLIKKPCEVCGHSRVEAHHSDYSKPLDVRWLCRAHHLEIHGKVAYSQL